MAEQIHIVKQAVRAVLPWWISFCLIVFIFGMAMQFLPNMMNLPRFYGTQWANNLTHHDPFSNMMIAEQGYGKTGRIDLQTSVRYPAFPMAVRFTMRATGWSGPIAMFWVSKLFLFGGLVGLWLLVMHLHGEEQANRAVPYMLFPLLGSGYTWMMSFPEPVHLFTWTLGFYFILTKRYYLCGLVTVLGVWSRPQALLILPAYALILLDELRRKEYQGVFDTRLWRNGLFVGVIPFVAHSAWILHISKITQLPFSPITAQAPYGRSEFQLPWERVWEHIQWVWETRDLIYRPETVFEVYQFILIALALCGMVYLVIRRQLPLGILVFSALCVGLGLSTAIFASGRYALLTWIPVVAIYFIPKKYDQVIIPIGVSFSFLLVVLLSMTEWRFTA